MSDCNAVNCPKKVGVGKLMCLHHWRMVTLSQQRTINTLYRLHPNVYSALSDTLYLNACAHAIEGVALAENQPIDNQFRRLLNLRALSKSPRPAEVKKKAKVKS